MVGEKLTKLEKPLINEYRSKRKLYFVPLIFAPKEEDLSKMVEKYWKEAHIQLLGLEKKLGEPKRLYYEMVPMGGKEGIKAIEGLKAGWQIVKERLDKGVEFIPIEDKDMLTEFMDWGKCLNIGLQNEKVFNKIYEWYMETRRKRHHHIAQVINKTLRPAEAGVLFMEEGGVLELPKDFEVFRIAPPTLEEIKQRIREKHLKNQG
jgi:hypothetical protein